MVIKKMLTLLKQWVPFDAIDFLQILIDSDDLQ